MSLPAPVLFRPGIPGRTLRDGYLVGPEIVRSVAKVALKSDDRITLHPDNRRDEVQEPAHVVKDHVFAFFSKESVEELRHNLTPEPEKPVSAEPIVSRPGDDFGFWKRGGKLLAELGFHGALPRRNVAVRPTISHPLGRKRGVRPSSTRGNGTRRSQASGGSIPPTGPTARTVSFHGAPPRTR